MHHTNNNNNNNNLFCIAHSTNIKVGSRRFKHLNTKQKTQEHKNANNKTWKHE